MSRHEITNTFPRTDMDSLPVFCSGGASLLVLSVSYEWDEAEWANVANIVLRVQPGRLEQSVALSLRLDILSRRSVSHLPDSTSDRQSTRDIFSVITTSLGLTSRISLVQLSNFWNGDSFKRSHVSRVSWLTLNCFLSTPSGLNRVS